MKVYKHKSYQEYIDAQIRKNVKKINKTWLRAKDLDPIVKHAKENIDKINFGICHGVRNGWEVQELREQLGADIIGTDISHTAIQFEHVIEWDFHKIKPEWIHNVDFIYSNSLDHSNNPAYCLSCWMRCLKPGGVCYIHWGRNHNSRIDASDCFSASQKEYRKLINKYYRIVCKLRNNHQRRVFAIKHDRSFILHG